MLKHLNLYISSPFLRHACSIPKQDPLIHRRHFAKCVAGIRHPLSHCTTPRATANEMTPHSTVAEVLGEHLLHSHDKRHDSAADTERQQRVRVPKKLIVCCDVSTSHTLDWIYVDGR